MQTTTAKAAKPSAKQMIAAKKAAKQKQQIEKQAKQQIGAGYAQGDRNTRAAVDFAQHLFRKELKMGQPCDDDAQLTELIHLHWRLFDLVYGHPVEAVRAFEHAIRCFKIIAVVYADHELNNIIGKAILSLEKAGEHQDVSPNERRRILYPLGDFLSWVEAYNKIIPRKTAHMIAAYSHAAHCALYSAAYFGINSTIRACFAQVITGVSIHKLTKATGIKYRELYAQIIHCAEYFHEAMKCYGNLPYPQTFPDLHDKKADWEKFIENDYDFLKLCIRHNTQVNLIPFERSLGFSLIDYKKFRQDLINIELADI